MHNDQLMAPLLRAVGMLALVSLGACSVRDAQTLPEGFAPQACVSVEQARVLVTREQRSHRQLVIFGTA